MKERKQRSSQPGNIRKRSENSYTIQVYLGRDEVTGKPRYKSKTVRGNKQTAQAELTRILHELNTGTYIEPSRVTVASYLTDWFTITNPTRSPKTNERYAELIRTQITPAIGKHELSKLKPAHIQSMYTHLQKEGRRDGKGGLSARTVLHIHRLLKRAMSDAVRWQHIPRNPCEPVTPPKPVKHQPNILTPEQMCILIAGLKSTRYYAPTLIAVSTGMRLGEICALRWSDIDMEQGIIYVQRSVEETRDGTRYKEPKTAKGRRSIHIPQETIALLQEWRDEQLAPDDLVCTELDGAPIHPSRLSHEFGNRLRLLGLPDARFHDLRHSHATFLLMMGVNPKVVQERLGHATVTITLDTYSHVVPSMQQAVAGIVGGLFRDNSKG